MVRTLCLAIAVLFGSQVGTVASWISWVIDPSIGKAILSGGVAFSGGFALVLTAIRFITGRDA
ncbi:hypothetical protein [Micromonospora pallida]|nr:hypothetical protein [Micromonospora pallida]